MKVRMSDVWDRATAVLSGRGATMAGIAAVTILLPSVVRDAYVLYATKGTPSFALIGGVLSLVVLLVALWGQLAILGLASDPATGRADAQAQAGRRLLPAIGVSLLVALLMTLAVLPVVILILGSGADLPTLASGGQAAVAAIGPGRVALAGLYLIALGIAALFVGARLALINPVVLHERLGAGALARSWRLTRGHTWRILGVFVLFLVVLMVAAGAAQFVVGTLLGLVLGSDAKDTAALIGGIAGAIVSTAFTVVALAFIAQLYVALTARQTAVP